MTPEQAIACFRDEELGEVTPKSIRLRKCYLDPHEKKRQARKAEAACAFSSFRRKPESIFFIT